MNTSTQMAHRNYLGEAFGKGVFSYPRYGVHELKACMT